MNFKWSILILMLCVAACIHEPIEPPVVTLPYEEPCVDYDSLLMNCEIGPFYNDLSPSYFFPTINPNNPNEFAYYSNKQVFKYDRTSKTRTLLADNIRVIGRMDWGARGWIAFSTISWKVWILKDDGSELMQITFGSRDLGPKFLDEGDWLVYSETEPIENSQIVKLDINAIGVDSFCRIEGWCSWDYCSYNVNSERFAAPRNGVAIYDKDGVELKRTFIAGTDVADIPDIEWLPDNENILFITRYGNNQGTIYKVNSVTDELTMIKEGCENRFYNDLAISPDGTFMLAQKGTAVVDGCDINTTWQIVKMDLDGNNEEVIQLTE